MKNCSYGQGFHPFCKLFTHFFYFSELNHKKMLELLANIPYFEMIFKRGWGGYFSRKDTPLKYGTDLRNNILMEFILE